MFFSRCLKIKKLKSPNIAFQSWTVVVAQLAERSPLTPEICGSNPNIDTFVGLSVIGQKRQVQNKKKLGFTQFKKYLPSSTAILFILHIHQFVFQNWPLPQCSIPMFGLNPEFSASHPIFCPSPMLLIPPGLAVGSLTALFGVT